MSAAQAVGRRLRRLADRIDHKGAPKLIGYSFTFERDRGLVFRGDRRGCRLAYLGDNEYAKAHEEADDPGPNFGRLIRERLTEGQAEARAKTAQRFGATRNPPRPAWRTPWFTVEKYRRVSGRDWRAGWAWDGDRGRHVGVLLYVPREQIIGVFWGLAK